MTLYLLDTDHISLISRGGDDGQRIMRRLSAVPVVDISVSIISYEEQVRGWLAEIAGSRELARQIVEYDRLQLMLRYYCSTSVLPFDSAALRVYRDMRSKRLRVKTMDLKIASVAIANHAILLTRNISDFGRVPGPRAEDWSI